MLMVKLLQLSEDLINAVLVFIGLCLIPPSLRRQSRNGNVACVRLDSSPLEPCTR